MKKINIFLILLVAIPLFITSCSNSDDPVPEPVQQIEALIVQNMNQAVELKWTNPSDVNYTKVIIKYGQEVHELGNNETSKKIVGLTNGQEYAFEFKTIASDNRESDAVVIKGKPDRYVTVVPFDNTIKGDFEIINSIIKMKATIDKNSIKRMMYNWVWEGTYTYNKDGDQVSTYEYYRNDPYEGRVHLSNTVETHTPDVFYQYNDSVFYSRGAYEKIEGDNAFLPGKYRFVSTEVVDNKPSSSSKVQEDVIIDAEGNVKYIDNCDKTKDKVTKWNNGDLIKGKYLFVSKDDKIYLVSQANSMRYFKK